MANTSDIKNGLCINYNDDIYSIVEFQHVKPARGAAFVRTKMKSFSNGKVIENTFPSGHKIDIVRVERRTFQFLYKDEMGYHFMDAETYEQVAIQENLIEQPQFIKEGGEIEILMNTQDDTPLTVDLPQYMYLKVEYAEPGVKGNTATNATKTARVETGAEVQVPLFINEGDTIKIETKTGSYMERAKN